ncbi:hypothetical protein [Streptomyces sp. NPDC090056]|uniref:hypothetical protein n=1 Tax=Streptomyces sp. NPDC090056 TaxID=3365934 RepID=UPI003830BEDC
MSPEVIACARAVSAPVGGAIGRPSRSVHRAKVSPGAECRRAVATVPVRDEPSGAVQRATTERRNRSSPPDSAVRGPVLRPSGR